MPLAKTDSPSGLETQATSRVPNCRAPLVLISKRRAKRGVRQAFERFEEAKNRTDANVRRLPNPAVVCLEITSRQIDSGTF